MTERKTTERKSGLLSNFLRPEAANVPAPLRRGPWVPPELPAAKAAPGRAVATRDRRKSLRPWVPAEAKRDDRSTSPATPWVPPPELPASNAAPVAVRDRAAKLKPWVPPAEAPRDLPAATSDHYDEVEILPPKKRNRKLGEDLPAEAVTHNTGAAGQPIIINNIINQSVSAPAPVVYPPWWGPGWWWRWWWW